MGTWPRRGFDYRPRKVRVGEFLRRATTAATERYNIAGALKAPNRRPKQITLPRLRCLEEEMEDGE